MREDDEDCRSTVAGGPCAFDDPGGEGVPLVLVVSLSSGEEAFSFKALVAGAEGAVTSGLHLLVGSGDGPESTMSALSLEWDLLCALSWTREATGAAEPASLTGVGLAVRAGTSLRDGNLAHTLPPLRDGAEELELGRGSSFRWG